MRTPVIAAALALALVASLLIACNKTPWSPPAPTVSLVPIESRSAASAAPDPSVPTTDSVVTPATQTLPDPTAGRTNRAMSRNQEMSAMPLPGQNNDHSAPLTPAKPASSP